MKKIVIVLTLCECAVIVFLLRSARIKSQTLGVSVNSLQSASHNFPLPSSYFYEPSPDTTDFSPTSCGTYQTYVNTDTLIETRNYPIEKSPGTVRIMTLGDSFTHGICVHPDRNWTSLLENHLGTEVINLGYDGYDLKYEITRYGRRGDKYQPDVLIWLLLENDFTLDADRFNALYTMLAKDPDVYDPAAARSASDIVERDYGKNTESKLRQAFGELDAFATSHPSLQILVFSYAMQDPKIVAVLKNVESTHSNFRYLQNIPALRKEEIFPDSHPTESGHRTLEREIYDSLTSFDAAFKR